LPPEPLILGFDTSVAHCAATLLSGNRVLGERIEPMQKGQAERLMPLLEELLEAAGMGWSSLAAIGTGIGPGNFTGIRIAVSAARGLALSLKIPAVGVSTFEALCHGTDGTVVTSVDGRRGEIYVQTPEATPVRCTLESLPPVPEGSRPHVIGHRAEEIADQYGGCSVEAAYSVPVAIARVAALRRSGAAMRPAPLYIRTAIAAPPRSAGVWN